MLYVDVTVTIQYEIKHKLKTDEQICLKPYFSQNNQSLAVFGTMCVFIWASLQMAVPSDDWQNSTKSQITG